MRSLSATGRLRGQLFLEQPMVPSVMLHRPYSAAAAAAFLNMHLCPSGTVECTAWEGGGMWRQDEEGSVCIRTDLEQ